MGWGIGIGIGWGGSTPPPPTPPVVYGIPLFNCTDLNPAYTIYSLDFEVSVGSLYYTNPNLTGLFTGVGSPAATGSDQLVFTNGLYTGTTISCA